MLTSRGLAYLVSECPQAGPQRLRRSPAARPHQRRGAQRPGSGAGAAGRPSRRRSTRPTNRSATIRPLARRAYNAARIYAQAAVAAAAEVEPKGRLAVTLVERYQNRAVALVKLALERTPAERRATFWQAQVAADPALRAAPAPAPVAPAPEAPESPVTSGNGPTAGAIH